MGNVNGCQVFCLLLLLLAFYVNWGLLIRKSIFFCKAAYIHCFFVQIQIFFYCSLYVWMNVQRLCQRKSNNPKKKTHLNMTLSLCLRNVDISSIFAMYHHYNVNLRLTNSCNKIATFSVFPSSHVLVFS